MCFSSIFWAFFYLKLHVVVRPIFFHLLASCDSSHPSWPSVNKNPPWCPIKLVLLLCVHPSVQLLSLPRSKVFKWVCKLGVSLKFHWYLKTLSQKFQKATSKIEVFQSLHCLAWGPTASKINRAETGELQFCSQPSDIFN